MIHSDVLTGQELIEMQLLSKDLVGQTTLHGSCRLELVNLKDQLMHDLWLDLTNSKEKSFLGRLHIRIQWIHSKITFYADLIERTKQKIKEETTNRENMKVFLDKLKSTLHI